MFARGRYGLVITDLNMPVMDGFELARSLRQYEAEAGLSRTPIVAWSANVMAGEAERCMSVGMDDFLGKPAPMAALADVLRRWMPDVGWTGTEILDTPIPPPAASGLPAAGTVIERAVLDEMTGADTELAATILADYVDSSRADLAALAAAVAARNEADVRRHAHRVCGASRIVGAEQAATLAARVEAVASARVDDWDLVRSVADDLDLAVARVAAFIGSAKPAR